MPCFVAGADWNCFCPGDIVAAMEEVKVLLGDADAKNRMRGLDMLASMVDTHELKLDDSRVLALIKILRNLAKGNNTKVCEMSLGILRSLVRSHGAAACTYFNTTFEAVVERLGDVKAGVRGQAQNLVIEFMSAVDEPNFIWDKLQEASLVHRNSGVRHSGLLCYRRAVELFGPDFYPMGSFLPFLFRMLDDQMGNVREEAMGTLVFLLEYLGRDFWLYLKNQSTVRPAQLKSIESQVDITALPDRPRIAVDWSKLPVRPSAPSVVPSSSDDRADDDASLNEISNPKSNPALRVASLCIGPARHLPPFNAQLKRVAPSLIVQAHDLRSAVAKEACSILAFMSCSLQNDFSAIADVVLPELLKLTFTSVQVIASAGDKCIRSIIKNTRINTAVRKILDMAKGKNPALRATCMEYLHVLLTAQSSNDNLERYCDGIVEQIRLGLSDANELARAASRTCFWAVKDLWPERAEELMSSLDSGVQKNLLQDSNSASANHASQKSRRRSLQPGNMHDKENSGLTLSNKQQSVPEVEPSSQSGDSKEGSSLRLPKTAPGGAVRVVRQEAVKPSSASSSNGRASRMQVAPASASSADGGKPQRAERRLQPAPTATGPQSTSADSSAPLSLDEVLHLATSKEWMERLRAMDQLYDIILSSPLTVDEVQRISSALQQRISDRHHKVASAGLRTAGAFVKTVEITKNGLERLLPGLYHTCIDGKEHVRTAAAQALDVLFERSEFNDLISELLRLVGSSPSPRLQQDILQALIKLCNERQNEALAYFRQGQHMRTTFTRLRPFFSARHASSSTSVSQLLHMLLNMDRELFSRCSQQMTHSDQAHLQRLLGDGHADSDEHLEVDMGRTASVERDIVIDDVPEAVAEHEQLDDDVNAVEYRPQDYESSSGDPKPPSTSDAETLSSAVRSVVECASSRGAERALKDLDLALECSLGALDSLSSKATLDSLLFKIASMLSTDDSSVHVQAANVLRRLLGESDADLRTILRSCCATAFRCLFALRLSDTLHKIALFEEAVAVFDFSDCIGIIEGKLSDPTTSRADLVTAIEFISCLLVGVERAEPDTGSALGRLLPLFPPLLSHTELEVRKASIFCAIDLYGAIGEQPLASLFRQIPPTTRKLLVVYIEKRRLPIPDSLAVT
ncbi:unnamed protein product (mitochondrion) [Plasmodiophora brassicae]|uniref:TOG domain-containing protein n=1 Tax=Plasmodiophora brassicae TaxID=37360 RepID=A0A3P3YLY3_PLABS|nr:unnamed protein product [Plasmodiophora brassicae]